MKQVADYWNEYAAHSRKGRLHVFAFLLAHVCARDSGPEDPVKPFVRQESAQSLNRCGRMGVAMKD